MASGTNCGQFIYIWNATTFEKIARLNSVGCVKNIFLNEFHQLVISSTLGVYVVDDCKMNNYELMNSVHNWTSNFIYQEDNSPKDFLIVGGCDKTKLKMVRSD